MNRYCLLLVATWIGCARDSIEAPTFNDFLDSRVARLDDSGGASPTMFQIEGSENTPDCLKYENGLRKRMLAPRDSLSVTDRGRAGTIKTKPLESFYVFEQSNNKVLLGRTPFSDSVIGWVDAKDLLEWQTQQVLKTVSMRLPMYESLDQATASIGGKREINESARWRPSLQVGSMPCPILKTTSVTHLGRAYEFAHIAYVPDRQRNSASDVQVDSRQRKIDLVFVIDNTASNAIFTGAIRMALRDFLLSTAKSDRDIGIGLWLYRDYEPGLYFRNVPRRVTMSPSRGQLVRDVSDIDDLFYGIAFPNVRTEDWPEAVYDGLSAALQQTKWRAGSERTIVLIADAPPHNEASPKNPRKLTRASIVNAAAKLAVRVHTLHLPGAGGDLEQLQAEREFRELAHETGGHYQSFAAEQDLRPIIARIVAALPVLPESPSGTKVELPRTALAGWVPIKIDDDVIVDTEFELGETERQAIQEEMITLSAYLGASSALDLRQYPASYFGRPRRTTLRQHLLERGIPTTADLASATQSQIAAYDASQKKQLLRRIESDVP